MIHSIKMQANTIYTVTDGNNEYIFTFIVEPAVFFADNRRIGDGRVYDYLSLTYSATVSINGNNPILAWKFYETCGRDGNVRMCNEIFTDLEIEKFDTLLETTMSENEFAFFLDCIEYNSVNNIYYGNNLLPYDAPFPQLSCHECPLYQFNGHSEMLYFANRHNIMINDKEDQDQDEL
jgi:hypothetical protein